MAARAVGNLNPATSEQRVLVLLGKGTTAEPTEGAALLLAAVVERAQSAAMHMALAEKRGALVAQVRPPAFLDLVRHMPEVGLVQHTDLVAG